MLVRDLIQYAISMPYHFGAFRGTMCSSRREIFLSPKAAPPLKIQVAEIFYPPGISFKSLHQATLTNKSGTAIDAQKRLSIG
jgi:hypothetical protein